MVNIELKCIGRKTANGLSENLGRPRGVEQQGGPGDTHLACVKVKPGKSWKSKSSYFSPGGSNIRAR